MATRVLNQTPFPCADDAGKLIYIHYPFLMPVWGDHMAKKMTKMSNDCAMDCHPHGRGKALMHVAIGVLLVAFGFGIYIKSIETLALMMGVLFVLKGAVKMMHTSG